MAYNGQYTGQALDAAIADMIGGRRSYSFQPRFLEPFSPVLGQTWMLKDTELDANNTGSSVSGFSILTSSFDNRKVFQSFTTESSGTLAAVKIYCRSRITDYNSPATVYGDIKVSIYTDNSGAPETLIDSATISAVDTSDVVAWIPVEGFTGVTLSALTVYWMVVEIVNVASENKAAYTFYKNQTYSGGNYIYWVNGVETDNSPYSMLFELYFEV